MRRSPEGDRSRTIGHALMDVATLPTESWKRNRDLLKASLIGTRQDTLLVDELCRRHHPLTTRLEALGTKLASGAKRGNRSGETEHLRGRPLLSAGELGRFDMPDDLPKCDWAGAERPRERAVYRRPLVIVRESVGGPTGGQQDGRPVVAVAKRDIVYTDAYFGASLQGQQPDLGYLLAGILGSALASWYWGAPAPLHEESELIGSRAEPRHAFHHTRQNLGVGHRDREVIVKGVVVPVHLGQGKCRPPNMVPGPVSRVSNQLDRTRGSATSLKVGSATADSADIAVTPEQRIVGPQTDERSPVHRPHRRLVPSTAQATSPHAHAAPTHVFDNLNQVHLFAEVKGLERTLNLLGLELGGLVHGDASRASARMSPAVEVERPAHHPEHLGPGQEGVTSMSVEIVRVVGDELEARPGRIEDLSRWIGRRRRCR